MPKLQDFRVEFDRPGATYAPGESVGGKVILILSASKNVRGKYTAQCQQSPLFHPVLFIKGRGSALLGEYEEFIVTDASNQVVFMQLTLIVFTDFPFVLWTIVRSFGHLTN